MGVSFSYHHIVYIKPRTKENMSLQEISKSKGIPLENLEIYNKAKVASRNLSSQVESHLEMCSATQTAVEECFAQAVRGN